MDVLDKVILSQNILLFTSIIIISIFHNRFVTRFPFRICMFLWCSIYIVTLSAFIATGNIPEKEKFFMVWKNIFEFFSAIFFLLEFVIMCTVILCVKYDENYDKVNLAEEEEED